MNNSNLKSKGFTFIELLIVIGVISISLPIIFGLFFINIKVESKVYRLQQVKREGDVVLGTMESVIRQYARSIHSSSDVPDTNEVCTGTNPTYSGDLYFKDQQGNAFRFYVNGDTIASESAKTATGGSDEIFSETSTATKITNWTLSCLRTASFSPPLVTIQFTVSQNDNSSRVEEQASLYYQTTIKLRN